MLNSELRGELQINPFDYHVKDLFENIQILVGMFGNVMCMVITKPCSPFCKSSRNRMVYIFFNTLHEWHCDDLLTFVSVIRDGIVLAKKLQSTTITHSGNKIKMFLLSLARLGVNSTKIRRYFLNVW